MEELYRLKDLRFIVWKCQECCLNDAEEMLCKTDSDVIVICCCDQSR